VQQAYQQQRGKQFPSPAAYQSFLKRTGQTNQDILFRFRINLIYKRLTTFDRTPARVNALAKRLFSPGTRCARAYRVSPDCGA
jgi:hypothetical protein